MSGPDRLIAGEATDFERRLLGSWAGREPSAQSRAKVLALAGAGLAVTAMGGAGAAAAKVATTSIAPKAALGWSAAVLKWIAVGVVGATATAGAIAVVQRARHPADPVAAQAATAPSPARTTGAAPATTPAATTAETTPAATIELGPDMAPAARSKGQTSAKSSTLDEELGAIDQARRALTGGDPAGALQIVTGYDAHYPNGALTQESAEIRIEALLAQGNRPAAERLAAKFTAAHPSSPYVHRLHALLAEPKGP
jgi:hypothetical protein